MADESDAHLRGIDRARTRGSVPVLACSRSTPGPSLPSRHRVGHRRWFDAGLAVDRRVVQTLLPSPARRNPSGSRRVTGRDRARDGLTAGEAGARFDRFGPNEIPAGRRASWRRRFARQLLEPMSLLLLAAAAVEGFGLGEWLEAIAILAIVVSNAVIGTV